MQLGRGVAADHALRQLNDALHMIQYCWGQIGPPWTGIERGRDHYLQMIDQLEREFRNLFPGRAYLDALHTERYWRIHSINPETASPALILTAELDALRNVIMEWITALSRYDVLMARPGHLAVVVDTNAFMHYRLFHEIPWCDVFGQVASVRLILPLAVLDQLDDKTYSGNTRLAKRAKKVLRALSPYLDAIATEGVASVQTGKGGERSVTLELLVDDDDHEPRTNIDSEILDRAEFFSQVAKCETIVVTADYGMRGRGAARGIHVVTLPEEHRLPLGDVDD